jgi:benzodiazapine receptor
MSSVEIGPSRSRDIAGLIASLAACFAVAGLGAHWTTLGLGPWYEGLRKPTWTPPNFLFAPVWTALYILMAVAAWLVWLRRGLPGSRISLGLFGLQLALNLAWPGIFFALREPGPGFAEIAMLWVTILATVLAFVRVSRVAAAMMVPYLVWVSYASALNFAIWRLNAAG